MNEQHLSKKQMCGAADAQPARSPQPQEPPRTCGGCKAKHSNNRTCSTCGRQADGAKLRPSGKVRQDAAKCADATIEPMPPKTMQNEWRNWNHKNRRGRAKAKNSNNQTCSTCGRHADGAKLRPSGKVRHDAAKCAEVRRSAPKCADATIEPMPPKTMQNEWRKLEVGSQQQRHP